MLYFDFSTIFKLRNISSPYRLLIDNGIASKTAQKIINGSGKTILLEHMETICRLLHCTPNDVIRFKPDANQSMASDYPLNGLQKKAEDLAIGDMLQTIPLDQLKSIAALLKQQKTEG
jgi:DNA-binding Xre family transcriptional regulator